MNVLVYSGESSLEHLHSLRQILFPNYAVTSITKDIILNEPWAKTCAMLVITGEDYLALRHHMGVKGTRLIRQFVQDGGLFLGINAGACYGSSGFVAYDGDDNVEDNAETNLGFFPGRCQEVQRKEETFRVAKLNIGAPVVDGKQQECQLCLNGCGTFLDVKQYAEEKVETLAWFAEDNQTSGEVAAATIYCPVGKGACILTIPHIELDPRYPAPESRGIPSMVGALSDSDATRLRFLGDCITKLGLKRNSDVTATPSLSSMLISTETPSNADQLMNSLEGIMSEGYIVDEHDTFHLEMQSDRGTHQVQIGNQEADQVNKPPSEGTSQRSSKHIVVYNRDYPNPQEAPLFDHNKFFSNLTQGQSPDSSYRAWFGKYLMYGEVMESTNTVLASNHKLLHLLPTGFTALASIQTSGRGRGSNVWVSPVGCLLFSTCVRHPFDACQTSPVLFVQYIISIAIVQAIKSYAEGYGDFPVKIKWPNDIYVEESRSATRSTMAKIGGILVQSSTFEKEYLLVVGVGLNTTNASPTTSLTRVVDTLNVGRIRSGLPMLEPLSPEKLLARILVAFERLYIDFRIHGWDGTLKNLYTKHWLHSDQIVTIESIDGAPRGRIIGVSSTTSHLLVQELGNDNQPTSQIHELGPDGNSFDFFHGLLKSKAS
ncbi:putative biotin apo-protein ligase [Xylaria flabelliformis]|nr:putative biotin apo-protein ligase [Xylaria flabelliformis]